MEKWWKDGEIGKEKQREKCEENQERKRWAKKESVVSLIGKTEIKTSNCANFYGINCYKQVLTVFDLIILILIRSYIIWS